MMRLFRLVLAAIFLPLLPLFPAEVSSRPALHLPPDLVMFRRCYPDVKFSAGWDGARSDWRLSLVAPERPGSVGTKSAEFYWAGGRMLPEEELSRSGEWWSLLYGYDAEIRDPSTLTQEEVEEMKTFGSEESQRETAGSPMFFFDFLYDCTSRSEIERHIVQTTFLGKRTKIHERIVGPLSRVEQKILGIKDDPDVKKFIDTLATADAYFWRTIANTPRKSFHCYGIAVDVLPKRLYGKETYWSWAKDSRGDRWMLTPLSQRWSPPKSVVKIFEGEGFIWGGKWAVWDTMHFEYHPELIEWNGIGGR